MPRVLLDIQYKNVKNICCAWKDFRVIFIRYFVCRSEQLKVKKKLIIKPNQKTKSVIIRLVYTKLYF